MLVRICPKCRHHNQPEASYCVKCGQPIGDQPVVESDPQTPVDVN